MSDASPRRGVAIVAALFAVAQLPFLGGAFRVDDTNILAIARRIAIAPLDPYGFDFNWTGFARPAFDILANPPLVPLMLATWAKLFGWSEVSLHSLTVLCGIAAMFAFGSLAGSFGRAGAIFPALLAVSPAFFVASHVVMPDIEMLALMIGAVAAAMRFRESGSRTAAALAFLCGFLVPLAKYNGAIAIPVLAAIAILSPGRRRALSLIAASPILGLAAWNLFTLWRYGAMHLAVVSNERRFNLTHTLADLERRGMHFTLVDTVVGMLVITGLAVVPLGWQLVATRRRQWVIALVAGLVALTVALLRLDYTAASAILFALGVAAGVNVFFVAFGDRERPIVAWSWLAAVIAFQLITIFIGVRYVFPLLPAIVLLTPVDRSLTQAMARVAIALSACVALAVAIGDREGAECYRNVARQMTGRHFYFAGHWGLQWYAPLAGGRMIDVRHPPRLEGGDFVLSAPRAFASLGTPNLAPGRHLVHIAVPCRSAWPVRTVSCEGAASWYANEVAGCRRYPLYLPFGLSSEPVDTLQLYVVE